MLGIESESVSLLNQLPCAYSCLHHEKHCRQSQQLQVSYYAIRFISWLAFFLLSSTKMMIMIWKKLELPLFLGYFCDSRSCPMVVLVIKALPKLMLPRLMLPNRYDL